MPYQHSQAVVRVSVWPLGADESVLAVGARRYDFPSEHEYLLLRVAANQGTIALIHARPLVTGEPGRRITVEAGPLRSG